MTKWLVRLAVWGALAVTIVNLVFTSTLWAMTSLGRLPAGIGADAELSTVIDAVTAVLTALVAALIIQNRPRNLLGWVILGTAFVLGLSGFTTGYSNLGLYVPSLRLPALVLTGVVSQTLWPLPSLGVCLLVLLFPTGQLLTPRWRWVAGFAIASTVLLLTVNLLLTPLEIGEFDLANPIGLLPIELVLPYFGYLYGLTLLALGASLAGMLVRYRRSGGVERQQMKWLLYVSALFILAQLINFNAPDGGLPGFVSLIALGFPIAFGIAILRYHLFDIDLIIRKTLTYAILTALLLAIYFGSVIVLQQVLAALTGSLQNEIVTVLSTLAIAALFVPLRGRIQGLIDRRFYRKKYDAQTVLNNFGATMRDETDLEDLTGRLIEVVQETMQPRSVSVWLRDANAVSQGSNGAGVNR